MPHRGASLVLDFLFPPRCVGCGRVGRFLCEGCVGTLPRILPPVCPYCGRPQISDIACPQCAGHTLSIDAVRSPFRFEGAVRRAILELKYSRIRALAPVLASLVADYFVLNLLPGDVLVPVPLHRRRLKQRGYNQSELLAKDLSALTGVPMDTTSLARTGAEDPQVRAQDAAQRKMNVAGAFFCRDGSMQGRRVILVDDVCTSGATLEACACAVKQGGAASVRGFTVARQG
ncbi:MAG: ComF family protein [Chloroflexota bacterium]